MDQQDTTARLLAEQAIRCKDEEIQCLYRLMQKSHDEIKALEREASGRTRSPSTPDHDDGSDFENAQRRDDGGPKPRNEDAGRITQREAEHQCAIEDIRDCNSDVDRLKNDSTGHKHTIAKLETAVTELKVALADREEDVRSLQRRLIDAQGACRTWVRIRPASNPPPLGRVGALECAPEEIQASAGRFELLAGNQVRVEGSSFTVGKAFEPTASNATIYKELRPLVDQALQGQNVTIIAYGQTGSGKTFTMSDGGDSVMSAAIDQIFRAGELQVRVRCIEVLNNSARDMIGDRDVEIPRTGRVRGLFPQPSPPKDQIVEDLRRCQTVQLRSGEHGQEILRLCVNRRSTRATNRNASSSRSHMILALNIQVRRGSTRLESLLTFFDLAGSERCGDDVDETRNINTDNEALRTLFAGLAEDARKIRASPSRCITSLLQHPLDLRTARALFLFHVRQDSLHQSKTVLSLAVQCHAIKCSPLSVNTVLSL